MKQASINITGNKKKNAGITLEGSLVLGSLHAVKEELAKAMDRYTSIHVTVKNVATIDLTGVQLLFAIRHSAAALHKKASFEIELAGELNTIISQAGFQNLPAMLQSVEPEMIEK
jgi:ABC-type transporter Mla MlaB component